MITRIMGLLFMIVFIFTGCHSVSYEEQFIGFVNDTFNEDKQRRKQQEILEKLERRETIVFNQIVGEANSDKALKQIIEKANLSSRQRNDSIEKEWNLAMKSKESMDKYSGLIKKFESTTNRKIAERLIIKAREKYKAHDQLISVYKESIKVDQQLYGLLKKKETPISQIQLQIDVVNRVYEKVIEANNMYNDSSNEFNKERADFLKLMEEKNEIDHISSKK